MIDKVLEEVVQAMVWPQEVELVITGLPLGESGHELPAILGNKQSRQFHNLEILGAYVGHTRRELKVGRFRRASRFRLDDGGSFGSSTSSDGGTATLFDLA